MGHLLRRIHSKISSTFAESLEEGKATKKERAPAADRISPDPDQSLDERNGLLHEQETNLPPGFLSPSVREYLELGKSIPGKNNTMLHTFFSEFSWESCEKRYNKTGSPQSPNLLSGFSFANAVFFFFFFLEKMENSLVYLAYKHIGQIQPT